jgi:ribosomal protein S27AE
MKFNIELSGIDIRSHKAALEDIFSENQHDVKVIDSAGVQACMKIFIKTFEKELCPQCSKDVLKANHLSYYNIIVKQCSMCGYQTATKMK